MEVDGLRAQTTASHERTERAVAVASGVDLPPLHRKLGLVDDPVGVRRSERETLGGFLDWYRAVVENKVAGLSRDQASTVMTPSDLCPLGVVKHLAWVERGWFRETFGGEEIEMIAVGQDNSPEFVADPHDSSSRSWRSTEPRQNMPGALLWTRRLLTH